MASTTAVPITISAGKDGFPRPQDLSTTPGGTLFATTPGGTRIIYDRSILMMLRNSPMSKTPPAGLNAIPGITLNTVPTVPAKPKKEESPPSSPRHNGTDETGDEEMFKMEQ